VVHLSGHGTISKRGAAFVFEDDLGGRDPQSARRVGRLFAGSGVRCAFVSGCESGRAPPLAVFGGICQSIVVEGVPVAIGWGASINDEISTKIAQTFYTALAVGQPADRALAQARWEAKQAMGPVPDPSWSLPVLYSRVVETQAIDEQLPPRRRPSPSLEQKPLPEMADCHAKQFIGRRRDLQQALRMIERGVQSILITGIGGVGKSAFATRLARKLEAAEDNLRPIVLASREGAPLTAQQVLDRCSDAFIRADQRDDFKLTIDPTVGVPQRLRLLVNGLNAGRFVLVLDNFEINLDERTRRIRNPDIAQFYKDLLNGIVGASRAIITSRYSPQTDASTATVEEIRLTELSETAYLKFMSRDPAVARLYPESSRICSPC
jgi:hypothetical protein